LHRLLTPLVPLYSAALGARSLAYERGWVQRKVLRRPVISIGNLSVGGSGKTPLTIRVAELLRERGVVVDVLSRGYGRRSRAVERVNPEGSADEFGDEPLLIAQQGVPVYVGANRYAAGQLAEAERGTVGGGGSGVHLLDDGFQHWQLARDIDIVTLHRSDFEEHLLPAGRLREGLGALRRAQIVVLREEDTDLEPELRRRGFAATIWWMERRLLIPKGNRVIAFCAIARPKEFFAALRGVGISLAAVRSWRDHHTYTRADVAELLELRRQHEGTAFVTTEKDLVRLGPLQKRDLCAEAPLQVAALEVRLRDERAAMDELLAGLQARLRGSGEFPKA
jgi:tetraacyldisaccharide 4'-kinase